MKSDIIRIFRGVKDDSKVFLGTVERPGEDVKLAFSSFDELMNILEPLAGKVISVEVGERQKSQKPNQGTLEVRYHGPEAMAGNVNSFIKKEGKSWKEEVIPGFNQSGTD